MLKLRVWSALFAAILIVLGASAYWNRAILMTQWGTLRHRPVIGNDFQLMKSIYTDICLQNSIDYHLAGDCTFPINTDTRRIVKRAEIQALERLIRDEVINSRGYAGAEASDQNRGRRFSSISTNTDISTDRIIPAGTRIARVVIRELGESLEIESIHLGDRVNESASTLYALDRTELAVVLFDRLVSLKKNAYSPLGSMFKIPYQDFVNVYGFGQCHNLSYALCDLFKSYDIDCQLVHMENPSHTVVEARLDTGSAVFDPLYGVAFADPVSGTLVSFERLRMNPARWLSTFNVEDPIATREMTEYYRARSTFVEDHEHLPVLSEASVRVDAGERLEYIFQTVYPWISARNVTHPPEQTVGFLRKTRRIEDLRGRTVIELEMPYPIVDIEIQFGQAPGRPDIRLDNRDVQYDVGDDMIRLRRYLDSVPPRRIATVTLDGSNSSDITVAAVSQMSIVRFNLEAGVNLHLASRHSASLPITIEYVLAH